MKNKQTKIYIITDTHFYHNRLSDAGYRPKGFTELIVENCRKILSSEDILINLGDVIFGNQKQLSAINSVIPCRKILVRGNHDDARSNTWFYKSGFDFVCNSTTVGKYVFSHYPIDIDKKQINIHGHFHTFNRKRWESHLVQKLKENHYLLSLEEVGYKPILLKTAIQKNKIKQSILREKDERHSESYCRDKS